MPELDPLDMPAMVAGVLDRWPSAGLAVGVVGDRSLAWLLGHGVADIASKEPVTPDTVFRVGSITKTVTAIAVLQLWEQGLVDLDAPANHYLRAFQLVPATASFRPATVRHLLTHTAGVGYWRRLPDLLRPGLGRVTGPAERARRCWPTTTERACRSRSSRGPGGPTPTTASPPWASWSRTSAANPWPSTCASTSWPPWGWTTPTWSAPSGSGPGWPPAMCWAPVACGRWPTGRS